METKEIQKLIDFIAQSGLDEVNIETSELKIKVKRNAAPASVPAPAATYAAPVAPAPVAALPAALPTAPAASPAAANEASYITVKSPMIGTFYRASSPEAPVLVNVGDEIKPGKPVCIIEAMKLFNEIESEVSGRIVKVLVENATPVEFDQPLFLVEPI